MDFVVLFIGEGGVANCIHDPHFTCIQATSIYGATWLTPMGYTLLTFLCKLLSMLSTDVLILLSMLSTCVHDILH